jgi:hypothetical protein
MSKTALLLLPATNVYVKSYEDNCVFTTSIAWSTVALSACIVVDCIVALHRTSTRIASFEATRACQQPATCQQPCSTSIDRNLLVILQLSESAVMMQALNCCVRSTSLRTAELSMQQQSSRVYVL